MSTQRQVKQIAIELSAYSGSFSVVTGYPKIYDIWNIDMRFRADWLAGSATTRALSGFDRSNPGGYRADVIVTFRNMAPGQGDALRDLMNDIFEMPAHPRAIRISPDTTISNGVYCNLRSSAFGIRRELTVGRQAINMQFVGIFRLAEIPSSFVIGT